MNEKGGERERFWRQRESERQGEKQIRRKIFKERNEWRKGKTP